MGVEGGDGDGGGGVGGGRERGGRGGEGRFVEENQSPLLSLLSSPPHPRPHPSKKKKKKKKKRGGGGGGGAFKKEKNPRSPYVSVVCLRGDHTPICGRRARV